MATGVILPGNLPDWFDDGSTSTLSNLFIGDTISLHRSPFFPDPAEVNLATTLLTVRSTNIPEPASAVLMSLGVGAVLASREAKQLRLSVSQLRYPIRGYTQTGSTR